jgi:hypothetical protein
VVSGIGPPNRSVVALADCALALLPREVSQVPAAVPSEAFTKVRLLIELGAVIFIPPSLTLPGPAVGSADRECGCKPQGQSVCGR